MRHQIKNTVLTLSFFFVSLYAEENAKQYNPFAETYSEIFEENNQDSIGAYFRYFDFPLEGIKVLDLGCGDGFDLTKIEELRGEVYGVDASEEMVGLAKKKCPHADVRVGLFEDIPFPSGVFDVVISKWAMQTAGNIDPIYREINRVLKPGGILIYLTGHPIRQFIEKKRKEKNYFKKEIVKSVFFDGQVTVYEPSHTMNEYLSPYFFKNYSLESFEEGFDSGAEKVDGDIYPSYFIVKATKK